MQSSVGVTEDGILTKELLASLLGETPRSTLVVEKKVSSPTGKATATAPQSPPKVSPTVGRRRKHHVCLSKISSLTGPVYSSLGDCDEEQANKSKPSSRNRKICYEQHRHPKRKACVPAWREQMGGTQQTNEQKWAGYCSFSSGGDNQREMF